MHHRPFLKLGNPFTTLFAALALLCAQLAPAAPLRADHLGPVAVSGHVEATVARLASTLTLVKSSPTTPNAKHGPPLDLALPPTATLPATAMATSAMAVVALPHLGSSSPAPYRARGPPAPALSDTVFSIS